MDLSIIIVNWNSKDYLRNCIESILANTFNIELELIVIDSASFDGCDEMLKQDYPGVRFIQSERNIGFAKSNNVGFTLSRGKYLLFLNPDTELVSGAINTMHDSMQRLPNVGAIGCKLLNGNRTVQTSCVKSFPTILNQLLDSNFLRAAWPKWSLWGMSALFDSDEQFRQVDVISGACIMIKRSVFEQVGLFSEEYFMYAEDVDLCYKIRQAGYANYYVPRATIVHFGGGSTNNTPSVRSEIIMRESNWRFLRKTRGRIYGLAYRTGIVICASARIAVLIVTLPARVILPKGVSWQVSLRKWRGILGWSLGFENWVTHFPEDG